MARAGDILGAFQLEEKLGRGAAGAVWAARHRPTGERVAVKVLHRDRAQATATFAVELQAGARLRHPAIVEILDCALGNDDSAPWLAMELLEHGSLREADRRAWGWTEVRQVLLSLLHGLAHAHARGVIHRDIKPSNLMLVPDDGIKITDFGIARARRAEGVAADPTVSTGISSAVAGTPGYMAPEQIEGWVHAIGPWTDLYAVGCVAWWLVTGTDLFAGPTLLQTLARHVNKEVPVVESVAAMRVPADLDRWLGALLAKRRAGRFKSAADAACALVELGDASGGQGVATGVGHAAADGRSPLLSTLVADTFVALESGPVVANPASGGVTERARADSLENSLVVAAPTQVDDPRSAQLTEDQLAVGPAAPPSGQVPIPSPDAWFSARAERTPLPGTGLGIFPLRSPPFVGRQDELALLVAELAAVAQQRSFRVAWVRGRGGVGKSHLVRRLVERAQELGVVHVMRARHSPRLGAADGLPAMLAEECRTAELDVDAVGDRVREHLAELGAPSMDVEVDGRTLARIASPRARTSDFELPLHESLRAVLRLIARRAEELPVLLWIDDIQWGFEAARLLRVAARELTATRGVFVVVTEREQPSVPAWLEDARALAPLRIDLEPLPTHLVGEMLGRMLALSAVDRTRIAGVTAGRALFALQLTSALIARGALVAENGVLRLDASAPLPRSTAQLWQERLAAIPLPEDAWPVLELAACLGRIVELDEWRRACTAAGMPPPEVVIEPLVGAGLATLAANRFEFAHGQVREEVESAARVAGRWAGHARVCADLVEDGARKSGWGAARWVLFLREANDPNLTGAALVDLAKTRFAGGDHERSRIFLDELETHLETMQVGAEVEVDFAYFLRVIRIETLRVQGDLRAARALATEIEGAEGPDARYGGLALRVRARVELDAGELALAERYLERAQSLELAAFTGPRNTAQIHAEAFLSPARLLEGFGDIRVKQGRLDESLDYYRRALALAVEWDPPYRLAWLDRLLGTVYLQTGDLDLASQHFQRAIDGFRAVGHRTPLLGSMVGRAEVARYQDDLDTAAGIYREIQRVAPTESALRTAVELNLGMVALQRGEWALAYARLAPMETELYGHGARTMGILARFGAAVSAPEPIDFAWRQRLEAALDEVGELGRIDRDLAVIADAARTRLDRAGERGVAARLAGFARDQREALRRKESTRVEDIVDPDDALDDFS